MPKGRTIDLANLFGISERRVQQLVKEGLPRESRGQFDFVGAVKWYTRYLHAALERKAVPTGSGDSKGYVGEREARIRQITATADLKELELAEKRGQLVAIHDVEIAMTDLVVVTKARIMAIPARLAPDLVGETSRFIVQRKLDKACREALSYLAKSVGEDGQLLDPTRLG
jgi:phage terminase Nu1 subunit (DNA packaging protein)